MSRQLLSANPELEPTSRRRFLVAAAGCAGAAALGGCGLGVADRDPPPATEPTFYRNLAKGGQLDPAAAASMISGYRRNNGLSAVTLDPKLMHLAEEQARAMATRDRMDHDVAGSFSARVRNSGYDAKVAVENIGAGYHTLAEAFSGWRDSPGHRANMLKRGATQMGIAAIYTPRSKYKVFWSLVLAAPDERHG